MDTKILLFLKGGKAGTPGLHERVITGKDGVPRKHWVKLSKVTYPSPPIADYSDVFARQHKAVEERYRGTPQWMKAPNGQPTKLNERQWVQVRTPAFKQWFGDWEAHKILGAPPIAFLHVADEPQGGYKEVANWAARIFEKQGGVAVRQGFGNVLLDHRAAQTSMAHGGANKYKKVAFAAVKDVIERGALVHQSSTAEEDSFYFSAPVDIDGITNIETVLVHRDVNTKRMYLHSVTTKENLLNQRVSGADDLTPKLAGSTNAGGIPIVVQDLLKGNGVSKVVDENGEPLVVYHGTDADIEKFDTKKAGEQGIASGMGSFFTDNKDYASEYAEKSGGNMIPVMLSLKNPLMVNEYYGVDKVSNIAFNYHAMAKYGKPYAELEDSEDESDTKKADDIYSMFGNSSSPDFFAVKNAQIQSTLLKMGYDGVVLKGDKQSKSKDDFVFVSFKSTQVKSAIGNNGDFSPTISHLAKALPVRVLFLKSHVKQYTDKNGRIVKEHDDKRTATERTASRKATA